MTPTSTPTTCPITDLDCDYLVVGAGAASIAFIDTILTELPDAKIVVVDKKAVPGGHWVDAYDFVHLHQPSLLYGVASRQLEGNWLRLLLAKRMLPWKHRASKEELLSYYAKFVHDKQQSGQLRFFPNCQYHHNNDNNNTTHHFESNDGTTKYTVQVRAKLVNGVLGECKIPALCPVEFPVDDGIQLQTPNQIYSAALVDKSLDRNKRYVVLGMGKTAMDTVVFLQRVAKVKAHNISWVIPNDVWMLNRKGSGSPWSWPMALLEHDGDEVAAAHALENAGAFIRLDTSIEPTKFRFPVVGPDELTVMRKVPHANRIRKGRVTAIRRHDSHIVVEFGTDHEPWTIQDGSTVFVHCTSPGPFNGMEIPDLFQSDNQLNLSLIYAPPVPISMSTLAYLEAARVKGTLNLDFGRQLVRAKQQQHLPEQAPVRKDEDEQDDISENEVLRMLMQPMLVGRNDDPTAPFRSIISLTMFIALSHENPSVGFEWLSHNRLSFLSIPGFKFPQLSTLVERGAGLGFSPGDICMLELLREHLTVLEGK